mmetsp:Transcript_76585/g.212752  ORF Transcript_76585/g.212752 Transcript_76585/m.212752 type:complete len:227 (+) Transcript_76585:93-773(+)
MVYMPVSGDCHARAHIKNPRMAQSVLSSWPISRPHLKRPQYEVLRSLRDVPPLLLGEGQIPFHDLAVKLMQDFAVERQTPAQDDVGNHSESPNVHLAPVLLLLNELGGQVKVRTTNRTCAGKLRRKVPGHPRQTEIGDLYVRVAAPAHHQDVFRLHVAVHYASAVDESNGVEQVTHAKARFTFREMVVLMDPVVKLAPFAQLQDEPDAIGQRHVHFDQFHKAWVAT